MTEPFIPYLRKWQNNPIINQTNDHRAVWLELLIFASYKPEQREAEGYRFNLKAGDVLISKRVLAKVSNLKSTKRLDTILRDFINASLIRINTDALTETPLESPLESPLETPKKHHPTTVFTILSWQSNRKTETPLESPLETEMETIINNDLDNIKKKDISSRSLSSAKGAENYGLL